MFLSSTGPGPLAFHCYPFILINIQYLLRIKIKQRNKLIAHKTMPPSIMKKKMMGLTIIIDHPKDFSEDFQITDNSFLVMRTIQIKNPR